jgi:polysaccharide pyruvyl transferase WcaK-like protein
MNQQFARAHPRRVLGKIRILTGRSAPKPYRISPASAPFLQPIAPSEPTDPPGPKVVLINDCRDQVNFGADALLDGLLAILRVSLPGATIVPIPSHWLLSLKVDASVFVDGGRGLTQPGPTFPALADQFETVAREWTEGHGAEAQEFLTRFEGADLVVLNGEGSIYRTNPSAIRELFLAWFAREQLGIPTVFINGMVHLTDVVPVLPAMVRKTFSTLDAVAVREPCSLRNLRQYAPDVEAQVLADSAFVFTADDAYYTPAVRRVKAQIGDSPYFCFDPGPMPMDHRSSNQSGLHQMLYRLMRVVPQAVLVSSGPADEYIREVAAETGSIYVDSLTDYREYMALVADAQFIASGRYHNPILAAIVGCPAITFASANHKVHGACEMLDGVIGSPYDGTDLRSQLDAIEDHAREYVANRAEFGGRLIDICRRRRPEALQLGEVAADALRRRSTAGSPRRVSAPVSVEGKVYN